MGKAPGINHHSYYKPLLATIYSHYVQSGCLAWETVWHNLQCKSWQLGVWTQSSTTGAQLMISTVGVWICTYPLSLWNWKSSFWNFSRSCEYVNGSRPRYLSSILVIVTSQPERKEFWFWTTLSKLHSCQAAKNQTYLIKLQPNTMYK